MNFLKRILNFFRKKGCQHDFMVTKVDKIDPYQKCIWYMCKHCKETKIENTM